MKYNEQFGQRLQQVRTLRGYDFLQLAKKVCINPRQLRSYEMEAILPSTLSLCRLAKVLHVSLDYLMGFSDSMDGYEQENVVQVSAAKGENNDRPSV